MRTTFLIIIATCVLASGCTTTGPNKTLVDSPLIARSALLEECPTVPSASGAYEFAGADTLALKAAGFVTEKLVDQVAKAIENAAEADSKPFIVKGSSPESLYVVNGKDPKPMGCLVIAVGLYKVDAKACLENTKPWLGSDVTCEGESLDTKMRSWGMEKPVFYAEVLLATPTKGPVGYVQPSIVRLYYPEPISDLKANKVKDVALAVTGSSATAGLDGGKQVFSMGFASGWLRPGTNYSASPDDLKKTKYGMAVPTFGHWFAIPMDIKTIGTPGGVGGPVNVETTFTEVPNAKKWLQALNKFVSENKKKAKEELTEQLELAVSEEKREEKKAAERESKRVTTETALKTCPDYQTTIDKLTAGDTALAAAVTPNSKARAQQDLILACISAQRQYEKSLGAWQSAGLTKESLCYLVDGGWPNVVQCAKP